MEKNATVSCSRFAAYRNLESGEISSSDVKLVPANPFGKVDNVCFGCSVPFAPFQSKVTKVELSSCNEYTQRPLGWNTKWRGPAPDGSETKGGSFGDSLPVSTSNFQI